MSNYKHKKHSEPDETLLDTLTADVKEILSDPSTVTQEHIDALNALAPHLIAALNERVPNLIKQLEAVVPDLATDLERLAAEIDPSN